MDDKLQNAIIGVLLAVLGVGVVGVLVSKLSDTPNVITQLGNSFAGAIKCAVSPITGGSCGGSSTLVTSTISFGNVL